MFAFNLVYDGCDYLEVVRGNNYCLGKYIELKNLRLGANSRSSHVSVLVILLPKVPHTRKLCLCIKF